MSTSSIDPISSCGSTSEAATSASGGIRSLLSRRRQSQKNGESFSENLPLRLTGSHKHTVSDPTPSVPPFDAGQGGTLFRVPTYSADATAQPEYIKSQTSPVQPQSAKSTRLSYAQEFAQDCNANIAAPNKACLIRRPSMRERLRSIAVHSAANDFGQEGPMESNQPLRRVSVAYQPRHAGSDFARLGSHSARGSVLSPKDSLLSPRGSMQAPGRDAALSPRGSLLMPRNQSISYRNAASHRSSESEETSMSGQFAGGLWQQSDLAEVNTRLTQQVLNAVAEDEVMEASHDAAETSISPLLSPSQAAFATPKKSAAAITAPRPASNSLLAPPTSDPRTSAGEKTSGVPTEYELFVRRAQEEEDRRRKQIQRNLASRAHDFNMNFTTPPPPRPNPQMKPNFQNPFAPSLKPTQRDEKPVREPQYVAAKKASLAPEPTPRSSLTTNSEPLSRNNSGGQGHRDSGYSGLGYQLANERSHSSSKQSVTVIQAKETAAAAAATAAAPQEEPTIQQVSVFSNPFEPVAAVSQIRKSPAITKPVTTTKPTPQTPSPDLFRKKSIFAMAPRSAQKVDYIGVPNRMLAGLPAAESERTTTRQGSITQRFVEYIKPPRGSVSEGHRMTGRIEKKSFTKVW